MERNPARVLWKLSRVECGGTASGSLKGQMIKINKRVIRREIDSKSLLDDPPRDFRGP